MNRYIAFAAPSVPRESDDRPNPRFLEVLRRAMAELPLVEPAEDDDASPAVRPGPTAATGEPRSVEPRFVETEIVETEPLATLVTLRTTMTVLTADPQDSGAENPDDDCPTVLPLEAAWMGWDSADEPGPESPAAAEPEEVAPVAAAAAPPIRFDGFGTLDILDRFTEDELAELERYFLHTIGRCGPPHHPVRTARLLLRLSRKELELLGEWAERHFTGSAAA